MRAEAGSFFSKRASSSLNLRSRLDACSDFRSTSDLCACVVGTSGDDEQDDKKLNVTAGSNNLAKLMSFFS